MKRLLILLILLFALPAYAQQCSEENPCPELARLMVVGGSTPAATGCADGFELCSEFPNLTGWTQKSGEWAAAGTLTKTAGDDEIIAYTAASLANAYRQYAKVKIANYDVGGGSYPYFGLILRGKTFTDETSYGCYFYAADSYMWIGYSGTTYNETGGTTGTVSPAFATNVWVGFEVENTGANTIFRFWSWASDPGARSAWGAADATVLDDPTSAADDGLVAGITMAIDASSLTHALDFWYAGSSAVGP